MRVAVRLYAGARAAAGTATTELELPAGASVADALAALVASHPGLAAVIPACSVLMDEVRAGPGETVGPGATLDVLPPFSGG